MRYIIERRVENLRGEVEKLIGECEADEYVCSDDVDEFVYLAALSLTSMIPKSSGGAPSIP
jgi:hypothetical protein